MKNIRTPHSQPIDELINVLAYFSFPRLRSFVLNVIHVLRLGLVHQAIRNAVNALIQLGARKKKATATPPPVIVLEMEDTGAANQVQSEHRRL